MMLLIDNYDSFSYNLVHFLETLGEPVKVVRNDAMPAKDMLKLGADAILISPGPSNPDNAGECLEVVNLCAKERVPLFGVCLGMQTITQAFGGQIVSAKRIMHGKISAITHSGAGVFKGLPSPLNVVRYHSLAANKATLPQCLEITAAAEDGEIMAIKHKELPIEGVQFHPESIMTSGGKRLLANFINSFRQNSK
ncbi:MAG: aminodeoxychorismate/anthranilate synthase component II [Opitutales bacterium]|nr:aminodeoxychorismate/anthranilate synthase component II [Opitutales bacterium]